MKQQQQERLYSPEHAHQLGWRLGWEEGTVQSDLSALEQVLRALLIADQQCATIETRDALLKAYCQGYEQEQSGYVPRQEVRGMYQVTVYPEHEYWQLRYRDGSLGEVHWVDTKNNPAHYPQCQCCKRLWSPQDSALALYLDLFSGQLPTCPICS